MNEDDSQKIAGIYTSRGWQLTKDRKDADLVIINSCTVRQHAEDRAVSELGRLRKWKDAKSGRKIIFAGCAAERLGETLKKRFPFLDDFVGARNQDKFEKLAGEEQDVYTQAKLFNSPVTDYLTIMRGCSMKCAYCIVPAVRGPAVSIPLINILREAERKASEGIKEIILLGQTVNCWKDPHSGENFPALLKKLCLIKGLERIKFMSPHPIFFDEDFFITFAQNPKLARHIHLPAQSGSERILKLMKRGYSASSYLKIVQKLRKAVPEVSLSTDFIVGFPGETEEDFQKTLELARKALFSFAFCFKYSPRTDRPQDISDVDEKEAAKRLARLLEVIKKGSKEIFQERIGKTEEVLLEKEGFGKTSTGFNCAIIDSKKTSHGSAVKVKIERAAGSILYGKVLK
ncbi:MAG: tRNA (N6-isopentenyl adenosine(37)-C2)-methylthiotransferase MiaB [Elusimicrobiota bacterium]